ncbi:MAG: MgtC/SapB family protein [Nitriliruptorales bacterium]|nr:MgtC/SapB family protein [Nitriliruptorales bacterium]
MDLEPLWRVLIAAGLSVPVGLERELRGKAAGLRTHVVVAVASAALGWVSTSAATAGGSDPTRIAAQVVTGIGFMGAGVIFASGGRVHGLTTAAALWSAMAVGLCVGLGDYGIAVALVVVTLVFLAPVDSLSTRLTRRFGYDERTFQFVADDLPALQQGEQALRAVGAQVRQMDLALLGDHFTATMLVRCRGSDVPAIYSNLNSVDGVRFVSGQALERGES